VGLNQIQRNKWLPLLPSGPGGVHPVSAHPAQPSVILGKRGTFVKGPLCWIFFKHYSFPFDS